jgi:ribosomal protein RSM22 (predicted rRNA methylase)
MRKIKRINKKLIPEAEVTRAAIEKDLDFKSKDAIDLIAVYENLVNEELTIDNINSLLSLYNTGNNFGFIFLLTSMCSN